MAIVTVPESFIRNPGFKSVRPFNYIWLGRSYNIRLDRVPLRIIKSEVQMIRRQLWSAVTADFYGDDIRADMKHFAWNLRHHVSTLLTTERYQLLTIHIDFPVTFQTVTQYRCFWYLIKFQCSSGPHRRRTARVAPNFTIIRLAVVVYAWNFGSVHFWPSESAFTSLPG
ncbi:hypothetical protein D3C85_1370800 [compost metagenome]